MAGDPLSFRELRAANVARCERHYHRVDAWSLSEWLVAVTGELGEAATIVKHVQRLASERGDNGHAITPPDVELLADELADTAIYLDLLAARAGIDLGRAVRAKFNRVSLERLNSAIVLERTEPADRIELLERIGREQQSELDELRELVEPTESLLVDAVRELRDDRRDARAALLDLVNALALEDAPRLDAIAKAGELLDSWGTPPAWRAR